ncbi:MAG TPA: nitroreductase family protein [Candidatus Baltobacteraceae bacterium]|nr:nitroreductase family protein [Verrucomicrobiae bacterium]HTX14071.1 nitroreductase family protein [Candidatus Baltobacteraceae bacterium]
MPLALEAIRRRRSVKVFEPVQIPESARREILDAACLAPSSFNIQPYRFFWIESPPKREIAAKLCFGQPPAATASALVVAVADIGSWKSTAAGHVAWMRTAGFSAETIADSEKKARLVKWFFIQGWFNVVGAIKWAILRLVHTWKIIGVAPYTRQGLFKWAVKSASLACQNLMIAAEELGFNTCPMEGFDAHRLAKFLGLSSRHHEIFMVIAIGKKSSGHADRPQWRRPIESTVTFL